jgi:hypothetical protein
VWLMLESPEESWSEEQIAGRRRGEERKEEEQVVGGVESSGMYACFLCGELVKYRVGAGISTRSACACASPAVSCHREA